jgi:hypothetical protein
MISRVKDLIVLEHLFYLGETHVLSILVGIRISYFRPVSDVIDTREQCGD